MFKREYGCVFMDSSSDVKQVTDVMCSDVTVIPVKSLRKYPNSKPWVTQSLFLSF